MGFVVTLLPCVVSRKHEDVTNGVVELANTVAWLRPFSLSLFARDFQIKGPQIKGYLDQLAAMPCGFESRHRSQCLCVCAMRAVPFPLLFALKSEPLVEGYHPVTMASCYVTQKHRAGRSVRVIAPCSYGGMADRKLVVAGSIPALRRSTRRDLCPL